MSLKKTGKIALLSIACLALLLAGCAQAPPQGGGAASVAPSVTPTQPSAGSGLEEGASATPAAPSWSAAQQAGGTETPDGEFVFDLPDGSDAQGAGGDGIDNSGMDSFG